MKKKIWNWKSKWRGFFPRAECWNWFYNSMAVHETVMHSRIFWRQELKDRERKRGNQVKHIHITFIHYYSDFSSSSYYKYKCHATFLNFFLPSCFWIVHAAISSKREIFLIDYFAIWFRNNNRYNTIQFIWFSTFGKSFFDLSIHSLFSASYSLLFVILSTRYFAFKIGHK